VNIEISIVISHRSHADRFLEPPSVRGFAAGLVAAAFGALLLRLFPGLELKLFAGSAARLVGLFTGSPVLWTGQCWELPSATVPVAITAACSATDFFLMAAALIAWQLARRGRRLAFAIPTGVVVAAPLAISINALRIIAVAEAHRWVIPLFPDAYEPLLHMLTGAAVFLPSLIVLNLLLEFHGRRHTPSNP
jgi:exosortase/archaeosortase family protein